jgi:AraC-like DNA-binding protein
LILSFIIHAKTAKGDPFSQVLDFVWTNLVRRCRPFITSGNTTPPDIANSFLQIVDCDYPSLLKRLFIESKFREILTRIIAHEVRVEEPFGSAFETEKIKTIPEILMKRIDTPPSIKELANELSINATTMKSAFKRIFGLPIYAYHRNVCLELAAAMLLDTKKTVSEIAIDIGYSSSVNFCYAFKKRYGISPGQYRKNGNLPL